MQISKKIRRLLLSLAYVFFLFIMKYYYENRLINFGSCIRRVIRGCIHNFKKIRRLLLPLAYVFIMKYYHKNRLISAKPALLFSWNYGSCIRRAIRGCMQTLKKIRRLLLPIAYVFFMVWTDNERGPCEPSLAPTPTPTPTLTLCVSVCCPFRPWKIHKQGIVQV